LPKQTNALASAPSEKPATVGSREDGPRMIIRLCAVALAAAVLGPCADSLVAAEDNPVLRARLEQKMVEDLGRHNSQETAWHSEKSVDRQKWTNGKLLGRKIRLASWTEESKSWIWLDDPTSTVSLDLKRLAIRDGRLEFAVSATAKARFKAWGRIPKFAQASVGGTVSVQIEIEGSAAVGDGHLENSKITTFKAVLDDLRFNNKAARPLQDLIEDSLNHYAEQKNEKFRGSLEKAIDRVRF
jgi:hypothetical protein